MVCPQQAALPAVMYVELPLQTLQWLLCSCSSKKRWQVTPCQHPAHLHFLELKLQKCMLGVWAAQSHQEGKDGMDSWDLAQEELASTSFAQKSVLPGSKLQWPCDTRQRGPALARQAFLQAFSHGAWSQNSIPKSRHCTNRMRHFRCQSASHCGAQAITHMLCCNTADPRSLRWWRRPFKRWLRQEGVWDWLQ